ncbi:MAG: ABC transporter substrate-binding protein [Chloroflexi bacterium]|nr:ABC transporter substrate-binding protein [Chloroflexota bacterium]
MLNTVRSGSAGVMGEAGQQLAQAQGYFAQEGVAVNFVKVDASTVFTTLIAGQVDVQGLGLEAGVFSALSRGVEFRIVATQASSERTPTAYSSSFAKISLTAAKSTPMPISRDSRSQFPAAAALLPMLWPKQCRPVG